MSNVERKIIIPDPDYDGTNLPQAGGGYVESAPETVIPIAKEYKLVVVKDEAYIREDLLRRVEVDSKGIARVDSNFSVTSLVAVRVSDHEATLVPFRKSKSGLELPLPGDTGSQIGFFLGHDSGTMKSVALRMGDYPGIPLTTESVSAEKQKEILIHLGGIKPQEDDELRWAEQIGLYDELGLKRYQSRGLFARSYKEDETKSTWKDQRLIVTPDSMRELVGHFDAYAVTPDKIQMLVYNVSQPIQAPPVIPDYPTRGMNPPTKGGLGIGFGNTFSRQISQSSIVVNHLGAAFSIKIVPQ